MSKRPLPDSIYLEWESQALSHFEDLLADTAPKVRRLALLLVRSELLQYSSHQPADAVAPAPLARLGARVTEQFRGRKRLARSIEPGTTTYGQLAGILDRTGPPAGSTADAAA